MKDEFHLILKYYLDKISAREPFAFYRIGDGELALIRGHAIGVNTQAASIDGWMAPDHLTTLGEDLKKVLSVQDVCFHFGIPCQCCDNQGNKIAKEIISSKNIVPANLFINANYKFFISFLFGIKNLPVSVVINETGNEWLLPFPITNKMIVPYDCVNYYTNHKLKILAQARNFAKNMKFQVVFVSAGPLSEILIFHMWNTNPYNTYIDVGSSLDIFTFDRKTRPYMDLNTSYAKQICRI